MSEYGVVPEWLVSMSLIVLKATLVLGAAWFTAWLLRRRAAAELHLLWLLTLAAIVALPLLGSVVPSWRLPVGLPGLAAGDVVESAAPGYAAVADRAGPASGRPMETGRAAPEGEAAASADASASAELSGARGLFAWVRRGGASPADGAAAAALAPGEIGEAAGSGSLLSLPGAGRLVFWLWLAGVAVVLSLTLSSLLQVRRLLRRARRVTDGGLQERAHHIIAELGITEPIGLLQAHDDTVPMMLGVLRPTVLLPASASGWTPARQDAVLRHELAHVRRRDALAQLLAELACALYWFHPLVWLAARRLRIEREHACDDVVLLGGSPADDYAAELVEIARGLRSNALLRQAAITMARPSNLRARVEALLHERRRTRQLPVKLLATTWAGALGAAAVLSAAAPEVVGSAAVPAVVRSAAAPAAGGAQQQQALMEAERLLAAQVAQGAVTVRDSAGVAIVLNRTNAWTPETAWRIDPEPLLRIDGSARESGEPFGRTIIGGLLRLDDGTIIVAASNQLHFFDGNGGFIRSVGQRGRRPGETDFLGIQVLTAIGEDSLLVWDAARGTMLGRDGGLGRHIEAAIGDACVLPFGNEHVLCMVGHELRRETLLAELALADQLDGFRHDQATVFRVGIAAPTADHIGRFPFMEHFASVHHQTSSQWLPFAFDAAWGTDGRHFHHGLPDSFEIRSHAPTGDLVRIVRSTRPNPPLTRDLIDAWLASVRRSGERVEFYEDVSHRQQLPAFSGWPIRGDPAGNLWLTEWVPSFPVASRPATRRWTVLNPSGVLLGEVDLPQFFDPVQFGSDFVLGVEWEPPASGSRYRGLTPETVVMYRLIKPRP